MPEISTIIVTYNSGRFIGACLNSLFEENCKDVEIIVVDNASTDDTVKLIREQYPCVRLIENSVNRGAAAARNQGVVSSSGHWVLTLDSDTVVERGFIQNLLILIKNISANIGIIQPKILFYDKKHIYSCGIFLSWSRRFYDIGKGKQDKVFFQDKREVFGACSAAALYKREMLEETREDTGYFDERFFFLAEDVDISWRAQKKGWKAFFYPEAICYHHGNSSGHGISARRKLCFRNRLLSISKNEPLSGKFKLIPVFLAYDIPRFFLMLLSRDKLDSSHD